MRYSMHGVPRFEVYLGAAAAGRVQTMRYLKSIAPQTALFMPEELARCAAQYGHNDVTGSQTPHLVNPTIRCPI
jgi:hypothetical protein